MEAARKLLSTESSALELEGMRLEGHGERHGMPGDSQLRQLCGSLVLLLRMQHLCGGAQWCGGRLLGLCWGQNFMSIGMLTNPACGMIFIQSAQLTIPSQTIGDGQHHIAVMQTY